MRGFAFFEFVFVVAIASVVTPLVIGGRRAQERERQRIGDAGYLGVEMDGEGVP